MDSGFPQNSFGKYQSSGTVEIILLDVEFSQEDLGLFKKKNIEFPNIFRVWSRGNKINHGDTYSIEKYGKLCSGQEAVWDVMFVDQYELNYRLNRINFLTGSSLTLEEVRDLKFEEPKSRRRDMR